MRILIIIISKYPINEKKYKKKKTRTENYTIE